MRANADKQTYCVGVFDVKTKEEENLANEERTDQAEEVSSWVTLS